MYFFNTCPQIYGLQLLNQVSNLCLVHRSLVSAAGYQWPFDSRIFQAFAGLFSGSWENTKISLLDFIFFLGFFLQAQRTWPGHCPKPGATWTAPQLFLQHSHHHPTIIPPSSHHHPTIILPSSHHHLPPKKRIQGPESSFFFPFWENYRGESIKGPHVNEVRWSIQSSQGHEADGPEMK